MPDTPVPDTPDTPVPGVHREADIDAVLTGLGSWADDERATAATQARSRRSWLRHQAGESTTLLGLLMSLAEAEAVVTVRTVVGPFAGVVGHITTNFCTVDLNCSSGGLALVPIPAITAVEGHQGDIADDRVPGAGPDLAVVLAALAGERPPITAYLTDGTTVSGALITVGVDLVGVRRDTDPTAVVHVRLGAIGVCVLN